MERTNNNYILTFSGKKFFALDPQPQDICIEDIAHALSRNNRFTGHCPRIYTVGEHCVRGVFLMTQLGYSDKEKAAFLLHDASEAYLQDIAKPFKQLLPDYMKLEQVVQDAIYAKYLGEVSEETHKVVKYIDEVMLINEMEQLMKPVDAWSKPDVEFQHVNLNVGYEHDYVKYVFKTMAENLGVKD